MNSFVIPFFFNLWIKLSSGVLICTSRKNMIDGVNAKLRSFQCDPLWPLRLYGGHLRSLLVARLYFSGASSYWNTLWVIWEASASRFYYDLFSPPFVLWHKEGRNWRRGRFLSVPCGGQEGIPQRSGPQPRGPCHGAVPPPAPRSVHFPP